MLARALYDNTADFADELTFRRGDTLVVIERDLTGAPGWWLCSFGGRQGIVPANRLQLIAVRDQEPESSAKNRGQAFVDDQPLFGSTNHHHQQRHQQPPAIQQQQQQSFYLLSPSSVVSSSTAANSLSSPRPPPAYSESDPNDNIYENFTSNEGENLYEDPTLWDRTGGTATPTMLKQHKQQHSYIGGSSFSGGAQQSSSSSTTQMSPSGGLLVTTTAHHRVNQPTSNEVIGSATYQANSIDSGVYSQPPSNRSNIGDYAEDIYDYPAAFQQLQAKFADSNFLSANNNDGIYDTVPGPGGDNFLTGIGDYDFVQSPPIIQHHHHYQQHQPQQRQQQPSPAVKQQQQQQQQKQQSSLPHNDSFIGDYDALPSHIQPAQEVKIIFENNNNEPASTPASIHRNFIQQQQQQQQQGQVPLGQQQVPTESMETLPEFTSSEADKAFENRRNVIERLVRYEHACTRAASRWSRLFGSSGWRKSGFLVANAYPIRTAGEQMAHTMSTFAAFAAAALSRLDFPTFATVSSLRGAYEPLYIESVNFKKYLVSVGLVNWTLENAAPHLTKTFEVMLHSQRTFLTNLALFSNILKRADFMTISSTHSSTHNLVDQSSSSSIDQSSKQQQQQQQHRTYMVVKDILPPASQPVSSISNSTEPPSTPRQNAQRGVSTVHITIPANQHDTSAASSSVSIGLNSSANNNNNKSSSSTAPMSASSNTLTSGTSTINRHNRTLRFAEDVQLVSQLAADLDQRTSELNFVVSTFVLSLRRTQPSAIKAQQDVAEGQRYNGGFIECGKLLVNVAHSVVLIGDKLSSVVTEPDRSESIKTSTDRLRVCIRVFVEKLKSLAGAGSRSPSAVDDLITHVEVLRSQSESIKQRLGCADSQSHVSTPTATLQR